MKQTKEQMQLAVTAWRQSGLSKKVFCEERNITYQTFHYWCKRLAESKPGFTQINVVPGSSSGSEIIFPSGVRLRFDGEPSVQWLRELVR
ncbi:MAG: hypothetical protein ABIS36_12385 [Chryseolinea sp.]